MVCSGRSDSHEDHLARDTCANAHDRGILCYTFANTDDINTAYEPDPPVGALFSSPSAAITVARRRTSDAKDVLGVEDALEGNATRFATQKIIEGTWQALGGILKKPGEVHVYETGTMGPEAANKMTEDYGGWIAPV